MRKPIGWMAAAITAATALTIGPAAAFAPAPPDWAPGWLSAYAFQVRLHVAAPAKKLRSIAYAAGPDLRITRTRDGVDVRVPSGDVSLAATLYRPQSPGQYPAVVLLHASTREGRKLGLYRLLGQRLAECGFIVMTLDQRGYGDSDDPADLEAVEAFDFVGDASRALTALAAMDGAAENDLHIIGHSLGASFGLTAALGDPRVRSITAIGPTRRLSERYPAEADYNRARAKYLMRLREPISGEAFLAFRSATNIENHLPRLAAPGHPPLLLLDGEHEPERDRRFLAALADSIAEPKRYVTLHQADHYSNTAGFGSLVIYDRRAFAQLFDEVSGWISRHAARPPAARCH